MSVFLFCLKTISKSRRARARVENRLTNGQVNGPDVTYAVKVKDEQTR